MLTCILLCHEEDTERNQIMNMDPRRNKVNKGDGHLPRHSKEDLNRKMKLRLEKIRTKPAIVFDQEMINKAFNFEQPLSQLNDRSSNAISIDGSTSGFGISCVGQKTKSSRP